VHKWIDTLHEKIIVIVNIIIVIIQHLLIMNKVIIKHWWIHLLIELHRSTLVMHIFRVIFHIFLHNVL